MSDYQNSDTAKWDAQEVRKQTSSGQGPKPKKKRRLGWLGYLAGVIVASFLLAGVGWLAVNDVCALNKAPLTATIEVESGDSVGTVATKLKKAGLINSKLLFMITSPVFHASRYIQPGVYELNTDMDYHALIAGMRSSSGNLSAETVTVTIPEGYTVRQTEKAIQKMLNPPEPAPVKKPSSPQYKKISSILAKQFGTPVNISGQGSRGAIEITFSSKAEFIRILELLGQDEWPDSK